jgi:hypothetical protein
MAATDGILANNRWGKGVFMKKVLMGLVAASFCMVPSISAGAQDLKATPDSIAFGEFYAFENKTTSVVIKNVGKETFVVDSVKVDCSCVEAQLSKYEIPPDGETVLKVDILLGTEGAFSHNILILPEDKNRHAPLQIEVKGKTIQPLVWAVGSGGRSPTLLDSVKPLELGIVHRKTELSVYIAAKMNRFNLKEAVITWESSFFELRDYRFIASSTAKDGPAGMNKSGPWLLLKFLPKQVTRVGGVRDTIRIGLAERVQLFVPITCRVVGDTYPAPQHITFPTIGASQPISTSVFFANGHPTWKQMKWVSSGPLSDALTIESGPVEPNATAIGVKVSIDAPKTTQLSKGYLFAHVTFYENDPTETDAVNVLVDGLN